MDNAQAAQLMHLHDDCSTQLLRRNMAKTKEDRKAAEEKYSNNAMAIARILFKNAFTEVPNFEPALQHSLS